MKPLLKRPVLSRLSILESQYKKLVERAYNLRQSDDSLSDICYYEAEQLLKKIKGFRQGKVPSS